MAKLSLYLNFRGNCEEAFHFYEKVFNTPLLNIIRYEDLSDMGDDPLPEAVKKKIVNVGLKLNEHTYIMGSDVIPELGVKPTLWGNQTYGMIDLESADEARRIYQLLSKNALEIEMPLNATFFAELYGSLQDQFGIWWMIHYEGNVKYEG